MAQRPGEQSSFRKKSSDESLLERPHCGRIHFEKSKDRGFAHSHGGKIPQGSARETPSKRKEENAEPNVAKKIRIVDPSDGTEWSIEDRIVIGLLKDYKSAPDQKTRDEILKALEARIISLSREEEEASQANRNLPRDRARGGSDGKRMGTAKCSSGQASKPNPKGSSAEIEESLQSKVTNWLQNLVLDSDSKAGEAMEVDGSTRKKMIPRTKSPGP